MREVKIRIKGLGKREETGNGKREKRETESGKRKAERGKRKEERGKRKEERGKREAGSGKRKQILRTCGERIKMI
jgi:hypothetical protein